MKFLFQTLLIFLLSSQEIFAEELLEKFHDWSIFQTKRGDKNVCYVLSTPINCEGCEDRNGEPFFIVTSVENDADEVTISSGFFYDRKSDVELSFDLKKFYLFPHKVIAWANDVNDDLEVIKEMQKEETVAVTGLARDGRVVTDTYSLIGFAQAYKKMKQTCK